MACLNTHTSPLMTFMFCCGRQGMGVSGYLLKLMVLHREFFRIFSPASARLPPTPVLEAAFIQ
jgi:hypothetical protein